MYPLCFNRISQYLLSLASLLEIDIFDIKSFLLIAACASFTLAPIEVPQRKSCFERIYSFFSCAKNLYS